MATQYLSENDMIDAIEQPVASGVEWPTAQNKKLALSFTKIKTFDQCPRKYYEMFLTNKYPYVQSEAAKWGDAVHKALEKYVLHDHPMPPEMKKFRPIADAIIDKVEEFYEQGKLKVDLFGEQKWAIDFTGRYTGYFDKNVWIRGQADVGYGTRKSLKLYDYKTGKGKYPDPEQLELMALLAVAQPTLEEYRKVDGTLLFIEAGFPVRESYNLAPGQGHRETLLKWKRKALQILDYVQRDYWPEKKSPLCGWCDVVDCPFNTRDERLRREALK